MANENAQIAYEAILVFSVKNGEEEIPALQEKFTSLIAANGTVDSIDDWGKRRLAYPIDYQNEGYYLLVKFTAKPAFPDELKRIAGITDQVIRLLVTRQPEPSKKKTSAKAAVAVAAE